MFPPRTIYHWIFDWSNRNIYVPKSYQFQFKICGLERRNNWALFYTAGVRSLIDTSWEKSNIVAWSWKSGVRDWSKILKTSWKIAGKSLENFDRGETHMELGSIMRQGGNIWACWRNMKFIGNKEPNNFGFVKVIKICDFFHKYASIRKNNNHITGLKDHTGN